MNEILSLEKLNIGYGQNTVAEDISQKLCPGEFMVILGPNGCGKSTLLKTVAGLQKPLKGSAFLSGENIHEMDENRRARLMSALFTNPKTVKGITVRQVTALGRYPYTGWFGIPGKEDEEITERSMELAGVADLAEREIDTLSDGQRQRVYIASAICQQPRLMLLDEPTSHLDLKYRFEIMELLKRLTQENDLALMCVVHDPQPALSVCDKKLCLKNGKVFDGSLGELYDIDIERYPWITG